MAASSDAQYCIDVRYEIQASALHAIKLRSYLENKLIKVNDIQQTASRNFVEGLHLQLQPQNIVNFYRKVLNFTHTI